MAGMPLGPRVRFGPVVAVEVAHGEPEDLPEAERDDGEVVAGDAQGRRADDQAEGGRDAGADEQTTRNGGCQPTVANAESRRGRAAA